MLSRRIAAKIRETGDPGCHFAAYPHSSNPRDSISGTGSHLRCCVVIADMQAELERLRREVTSSAGLTHVRKNGKRLNRPADAHAAEMPGPVLLSASQYSRVALTRSVMLAGSSSVANVILRSNPCGPVKDGEGHADNCRQQQARGTPLAAECSLCGSPPEGVVQLQQAV